MTMPVPIDAGSYDAVIEAIYAAAAAPDLWPSALDMMARLFDDVGCVLVFQRADGSYGTIVSPGLEAAQRAYVEDGWSRADIRMQRAIERHYALSREAVTERHLLSDKEVESLPFYTDFLAPHGLKWFAGISVSPDPRLGVVVSMQRRADRSPYTDEELAQFTRLSRHVETALRLSIRLINAEMVGMALTDAFSQLAIGVFLLDGTGRVDYANPAGRALVGKGLVIQDGRLAAEFHPERDTLAAAIDAVLAVPAAGSAAMTSRPALMRSADASHYIAVYVLPVAYQEDAGALLGVRAIVLAIESSAQAPDPTIVRDLLGLTLGEARIAALVGTGLPPRDAAVRLGISENTVRSALKSVFEKVGVSRQSELALLISRLVMAG